MHALENGLSLIVGDDRFGERKQWKADFLRPFLGFTNLDKEKAFNKISEDQYKLCSYNGSLTQTIGKKFTSLLRHDSPLKTDMYANGAVAMRLLFDRLGNHVHPWQQFNPGRLFASFLKGYNKQRFFIEVVLREKWVLLDNPLPWIVYIGCNQGHSTGVNPHFLHTSCQQWKCLLLDGFCM